MKQLLPYLAASILAFSSQTSEAQQKKFIDSSAIWIERYTEWNQGEGGLIEDRNTVYFIQSDTIIDQQRYGKIMIAGRYGQRKVQDMPPKVQDYRNSCHNCYVGAIRLDTIENKVFFRDKDAQTDRVLYDFDSIRHPNGALITKVDSFLFEGRYYKNWGGNGHFYYGVNELTGSYNSILDPSLTSFEIENRVECIHSPRLELDNPYCAERLSYVLTAEKVITSEVSVYPNPIREGFTLHLPEGGETHLIVCDASGKVILEEANILSQNEYYVSCPELDRGIYFLLVIQGQDRYQNVLVKE